MLESIREFYRLTKLGRVSEPASGEAPVSYVKVFHKQYPRMPKTPLPEPSADGELEALFASRQSTREYRDEPITLAELAGILQSCRIVDAERQPERRTYPSAGARFPVETYVVAFHVEGLAPGCYHYALASNALETLWERDLGEQSAEFVSSYVSRPAAAIVFTAVIARSEVKYGAKAYPMALIEAGHMAQNMTLACAGQDIGCCPILGFVNDAVSEALDLTGDEIPLYTIALGKADR